MDVDAKGKGIVCQKCHFLACGTPNNVRMPENVVSSSEKANFSLSKYRTSHMIVGYVWLLAGVCVRAPQP